MNNCRAIDRLLGTATQWLCVSKQAQQVNTGMAEKYSQLGSALQQPSGAHLGEAVGDAAADGLGLVKHGVGADVQHCTSVPEGRTSAE